MKLGGNRPPGDNPLLFSISGTGSFICPGQDDLLVANENKECEECGTGQNNMSDVGYHFIKA